MSKKLLIINIDENTNEASSIIDRTNQKDLEILYLNNNIINKSIKHKILDDLFKPEYATKIDIEARNIVKKWYKPFESKLKYFGLILPQLIENNFLMMWWILLKIEIMKKLIDSEKPAEIEIITEYKEDIHIIEELIKNKETKFNHHLLSKGTKILPKEIFKKFSIKAISHLQNILFKLKSNKNNKNNILVLSNLRQSLPLLKELKKNKNNVIIRAGENIGRSLFNKYCDYYITFNEYSTPRIARKLKSIEKILHQKYDNIKKDKKYQKDLFYHIPLFKVLEKYLTKIFLEDFKNLIKYIEITKNIKSKIDIVVTHNDIIAFEKTVVQTANKLNIPTVTMVEGFLSKSKISKNNTFVPFSSQKMALHSEDLKNFIIKNYKIPKERLVVTGHPMFDHYKNEKPASKESVHELYNIPKDKKIILYSAEKYNNDNKYQSSIWSAYTKKQYLSIYEELFKAIKNNSDAFLIIKKHPSEIMDGSIIDNIAKKEKVDNFITIKQANLHDLINASSIVIVRLSTIGLESMILDKPVVIMDTYFDTNDNVGYTEFNASLHAKKPGELGKILKNLLHDKELQNKLSKNIKKFINCNYPINDGSASKKMSNLIKNMIKK